ncbi:MAG: histidine phosphatase family protein [Gemmatimonadetes bacterium]|nr:histidine phosphatase family protein [Gemmatimonadota bacterium]
MTRLLLVRHAAADHVGRTLAGRTAGLHLNEAGIAQARRLAEVLARTPLAAVYTSPLERCRETAGVVAGRQGIEPRISEAFHEVDFGGWTGLSMRELEGRADWREWNEARSAARPPGGESMAEVVERALGGVADAAARHQRERVAVISHCDVIRPLLAHYLGFSIDRFFRLEIDPASVSAVEVHAWGARVLGVNWRPAPPGSD